MLARIGETPALERDSAKLLRMIEVARQEKSEIGAQTLAVLFLVASKPGVSLPEIAERTGIAQSTTSRNVQLLSKVDRQGKPGLDVVETYPDARDRRLIRVQLNKKGKRLMENLVSALEGIGEKDGS